MKVCGTMALTCFLFLCLSGRVKSQDYVWPRGGDRNGPYDIKATFGEYRDTGPVAHFHSGVDIAAPKDTTVKPCVVVAGDKAHQFTEFGVAGNEAVWVNDFAYVHLDPDTRIDNNADVPNIDTPLGVTTVKAHIHLEEKTAASSWKWGEGQNPQQDATATDPVRVNPLRAEGLRNYVDTARGKVWAPTVHEHALWREFTPSVVTGVAKISGKVDVRARAEDAQSTDSGSPHCGAYDLKYQVEKGWRNTGENPHVVVLGPTQSAQFDSLTGFIMNTDPKVGRVFDMTCSDTSTYYYWFTNTITGDGYWNTTESKNHPGYNAADRDDARYPDDKYLIVCWVDDIERSHVGDEGPDLTNFNGANCRKVYLENWGPKPREMAPEGDDVPLWTDAIVVTFTEPMDATNVVSTDVALYKRPTEGYEWQSAALGSHWWTNSGCINDPNDYDVFHIAIGEALLAGWEYRVVLNYQKFVDLTGDSLDEPHEWTFTVSMTAGDPAFVQRCRRDLAGLAAARVALRERRTARSPGLAPDVAPSRVESLRP